MSRIKLIESVILKYHLSYKIELSGFDESGREVLFTAAASGNSADEDVIPVAGKPRTPTISKPINNQNVILPNDKRPIINTASSDGEHRLVGLGVDKIYNAGKYLTFICRI